MSDSEVLHLLSVVKREDFVPLAHKALAFVDMEIPLREGGARGQVMLAPRVEARLLQDANVQKHERVLEVGAGSMQRASGVPVEIVLILEGLILLFLLMSDVIADRVRRSRTVAVAAQEATA